VDKVVAFAKTAKMGNPSDPDTQVGPVTTPPQFQKILDCIAIGKGEGAQVALGGCRADKVRFCDGWFIEPTIFTGLHNRMRIAQSRTSVWLQPSRSHGIDERAALVRSRVKCQAKRTGHEMW
jgi:acyl-CoA reductase-like NAD-dependent aldehyde dehydrogenase